MDEYSNSSRKRQSVLSLNTDNNSQSDEATISISAEDDGSSKNSQDKLRMKRQVGLWSGVALIVGTMIGSGIFISPGNLLSSAKSPGLCLVIWSVSGIYSLFGALSYAEIGTLIPKSGGEYIYFLEAFGPTHKFWGPLLAFIFSYVTILVLHPSELAIISLAFANYVLAPILNAADINLDPYRSFITIRLIAAICIVFITVINCYSVKAATRVQNIFTVAKLSVIAIIVAGGLYYIGIGHTENIDTGFEGSETSFGEIAQAFYGSLWAYDGWNQLNIITEELINPNRNLPLAIMISLPLTTCCYVLVNIAYLAVLTPTEIIESSAVAVDWGNIVLGPASFLIPVGVVMSVFGAMNGVVFTAGRTTFAAGKEGHMIDVLSYIHIEKKTPIAPILLNSLLAILMIIPSDIGSLINFFGFTYSIFYCAAMITLIVMRFTKRDHVRPIKVPIIIPIIVMIVSAYLVIGPIAYDPQMAYIYALLFILSSLIFYVPFVYYKKRLPGMETITRQLQALFLVAPVENEDCRHF